jgi:hypothetical protein
MTIIKLDAKAIEVLFPEGSEQRVELQNCVVAEFAKRAFAARSSITTEGIEHLVSISLKNYEESLTTTLAEATRKIQNQILKDIGYVSETEKKSPYYGRLVKEITLSQDIVAKIKGQVVDAFDKQLKEIVAETVAKQVQSQISTQAYWGKQIDEKIREILNLEIIKQVQSALSKKESNG